VRFFAILDKHSEKFFAMIQDGIKNNSGLRKAVRVVMTEYLISKQKLYKEWI
jgi:hypothetical protein